MPGIRAEQKEKTRQCILDAALAQLSAEKSFSNLSLREVTRHAGIAPTSFYRHFNDMEELGITLVDQCGVTLRQLMRKARSRIEQKGSVIAISVDTFLEFVKNNPNTFRLLLRERSGTSALFRQAIAREFDHFKLELAHYLEQEFDYGAKLNTTLAEGLVVLVVNAGSEALDLNNEDTQAIRNRVIVQMRCLITGTRALVATESEQ